MSVEQLAIFADSVRAFATVHQTTAEEFTDTLRTVVETPAIGTPLPFDGVSLTGTAIETEFSPIDLDTARTGVTAATFGIAEYGSVSLHSNREGTELVSLYTPQHVAVVAASNLEPDMNAAYERLTEEFDAKRDTQVLATGPSATADMGALVEGVHGPKEVHVIVLEDR